MSTQPTHSWREYLRVHPAADALPLLPKDELRELAEDIRQNGLQVAPVMWYEDREDKCYLLDGRNRLDAMELNGAIFHRMGAGQYMDRLYYSDDETIATYVHLVRSHDDDPATAVISANIRRRHLTPKERVELVLAVRSASSTITKGKGGRGIKGEISKIAEQANVSTDTVRRVAFPETVALAAVSGEPATTSVDFGPEGEASARQIWFVMDHIEHLSKNASQDAIASVIPTYRRAATARRLRKLGTYLGGIAWRLEGQDE